MCCADSSIRKCKMQFRTPEQDAHRSAHTAIFAAMETGNAEKARTILREYSSTVEFEVANELRHDVVESYGIDLKD